MRIVSLLPSATEIVFALGLGDRLEGVTDECDHPADARTKPVVSRSVLPQEGFATASGTDALVREFMERQEPLYALDKELLRRIRPNLILVQDLCRVCAVPPGQVEEALAELGTDARVLSLDPHGLGDVLESILDVARATGTEDRGRTLVRDLRERVERVRRTGLGLPSIRTLCLEWSDPPWVGGHWIPEMVELAGGVPLLNEPGQPSRTVTWRDVALASPEVVVAMPCGYYLEEAEEEAQRLFEIADFAETAAARNGDVFAVDASSYFSRPGPRVVDGLEILAWAIHPEGFPQPPPDAIVRAKP